MELIFPEDWRPDNCPESGEATPEEEAALYGLNGVSTAEEFLNRFKRICNEAPDFGEFLDEMELAIAKKRANGEHI